MSSTSTMASGGTSEANATINATNDMTTTTAAPSSTFSFDLSNHMASFSIGTKETRRTSTGTTNTATAQNNAPTDGSSFTFTPISATATSSATPSSNAPSFTMPSSFNFTPLTPTKNADAASTNAGSALSSPFVFSPITPFTSNTTTTTSPSTTAPFMFANNPFDTPAAPMPSSKDFELPVNSNKTVINKTATATTKSVIDKKSSSESTKEVAAPPATVSSPPPFPPPPVAVDLTRQYAVILNLEQKILDLVALASEATFRQFDYDETLSQIKHYFYHRQFEKVFNNVHHLPVYVAQYLPMRALCYANLWLSQPLLRRLLEKDIVIYTIGAGPGSEAVGITMAREQIIRERIRDGKTTLQQATAIPPPTPTTPATAASTSTVGVPKFRIHTQDMFDWTSSLRDVLGALAIHAPIAYRTTNFTFSVSNILDSQLKTAQFKNSHVITMMFVINELFQENKSATMQFLDRLITAMRPGAFLIVADSAGDFSQIHIGKGSDQSTQSQPPYQQSNSNLNDENNTGGGAIDASQGAEIDGEEEEDEDDEESGEDESKNISSSSSSSSAAHPNRTQSNRLQADRKKYWVYSLLDAIPSLSTTYGCNSVWYRYPEKEKNLKYPLKFENMRYFIRIYQKKA